MACVNVFVGQCGSQLGTEFLQVVASERDGGSQKNRRSIDGQFFRHGSDVPMARCVLIDMEPKAIEECHRYAESKGLFRFSAKQTIVKNEGSANNWSFGFHVQGPSRHEEIRENIRLELENADGIGLVNVVHSVAGGTGSGVGSFVSQVIRDEHPRVLLHHTCVWPFSQGEMTTQWYNAVHAVQHINESADSILLLSNDDIAGNAASNLKPSLSVINKTMSTQMASLFLPKTVSEVPRAAELRKRSKLIEGGKLASPFVPAAFHRAVWEDVIESVALDPRRKFFEGYCSSTSEGSASNRGESWSSVLQDPLRWSRRRGSHSALFVLRGPAALQEGCVELQGALHSTSLSALRGVHVSPERFQTSDVSCAAFGSNAALARAFSRAAESAEEMYRSGAFVHHFSRFGTSKDDFEGAIASTFGVAASYSSS